MRIDSRCVGTTKKGERCKRKAVAIVRGKGYCDKHAEDILTSTFEKGSKERRK